MTAWVLLALSARVQEPSCPAELRIEPSRVVAKAGDRVDVRLIVRNTGKQPIALVHPGDGSDTGRRTPLLRWWSSVVSEDREGRRREVVGVGFGMCAHVNSLKRGEVFDLSPGEERQLNPDWSMAPGLVKAGHHKLTVLYRNVPQAWTAPRHDPAELEKLLASTPCTLEAELEMIGTPDNNELQRTRPAQATEPRR